MRNALLSVRGFRGVTGLTDFAGKNQASKKIKILTIRNGEILSAQAADAANSDSM